MRRKRLFALALALALSLSANGWMLIRRAEDHPPVEPAKPPQPFVDAAKNLSDAVADAAAAHLVRLERADLTTLRDSLRAAGFDEDSARAVLGGVLRARHREQASRWQIERLRHAWWLGGTTAPGGTPPPSQRLLVHEPLRELLGRDPLDVADAEARYDFLPAEKRRLLALIDLDYSELKARTPRAAQTNAATKAEREEAELLMRERRKDVLAALTPAERAEYELRFDGTAPANSRRFAAMNATEHEFRVLKPLLDAHRDSPTDASRRASLEQRTLDAIVARIGYERALDYVWSMHGGHRETADLLSEHQQPPANASRLYQLAAETGARATAIHQDPARSPEQRRAELAALQQAVRPQFDALAAPELQGKLPAAARDWFTLLGDGSYKVLRPVLVGAGYSESMPIRIAAPPQGVALPVGALPRAISVDTP